MAWQSITDRKQGETLDLVFEDLVFRDVAVEDATALAWNFKLQDKRGGDLEADLTEADAALEVDAASVTVRLATGDLGLAAGVTYLGELWAEDVLGKKCLKSFLLRLGSSL